MEKVVKRFAAWLIEMIGQAALTSTRSAGMRREVEVDGRSITAYEITVAEMRQWLQGMQKAESFNVLDAALFHEHDVSVADLVLMSTASRSFIEGSTPSELMKLVLAVKEVNPFFFQFRQRLQALAQANP